MNNSARFARVCLIVYVYVYVEGEMKRVAAHKEYLSVRRKASQQDHLVAITEMIQISEDGVNRAEQEVGGNTPPDHQVKRRAAVAGCFYLPTAFLHICPARPNGTISQIWRKACECPDSGGHHGRPRVGTSRLAAGTSDILLTNRHPNK